MKHNKVEDELVVSEIGKDIEETIYKEKINIFKNNTDINNYNTKNNFKEIFQNMNYGSIVYETKDKGNSFLIKEINFTAENLIRLNRKDTIGRNILDVFPNLMKTEFLGHLRSVYTYGVPKSIPLVNYKDSRLNIWKENYLFKLSSGNIVSIFNDVNDKIQLDNKLKRYNMFLGNTKDIVLFLDVQGKIIEANQAAIDAYGYNRSELLNKKINDLRDNNTIHLIGNQIKKANKEGTIFETLHKDKSGNVFHVEVRSIGMNIVGERVICSIIRDISDRKLHEQNLHEKEERYRLLFENANDLVYTRYKNGEFITINRACEKVLGYKKEELLKMNIQEIIAPEYINTLKISDSEKFKNTILEVEFINARGNRVFMEISRNVLIKKDGNSEIHVIGRNITERKIAEKEIKFLTYNDKLTGAYNRTFYDEQLRLLKDQRHLPASIIFGDVNGLKLVNDTFGHLEGDKLLRNIVEILKTSSNKNSIIARIGGDEFVIITTKTNEDTTKLIINNIRKQCEERASDTIEPSIALGYAIIKNNYQNIENTIKEAENMMYRNKLVESKSLRSSVIASLQNTLYESTPETNSHCERVKKLAVKFGAFIGLSQGELDKLTIFALLHDIGKIAIPKVILEKPGTLTEDEWYVVKSHCQIGYNIANSSEELGIIAELILCHHERWDGKGYPRGLIGAETPLLSRIIGIIDAYDVMVSERPYKEAISKEEAINELRVNSGSQFDPSLTEKFICVLNK